MCVLVRTIRGQRVKCVSYRDNPGQKRNLLSLQSVRITAPVERLVVQCDAGMLLAKLNDRPQDIGALGRVGLHDLEFLGCKSSWLFENTVLNANFSYVMELRRNL